MIGYNNSKNNNFLDIKMIISDDDDDNLPKVNNDSNLGNKIDDKVDEIYKRNEKI